jgi:hypothetical protein
MVFTITVYAENPLRRGEAAYAAFSPMSGDSGKTIMVFLKKA